MRAVTTRAGKEPTKAAVPTSAYIDRYHRQRTPQDANYTEYIHFNARDMRSYAKRRAVHRSQGVDRSKVRSSFLLTNLLQANFDKDVFFTNKILISVQQI